jgi:aspartate--ammonia ligase
MNLVIPDNYHPLFDLRETERAIKYIKDLFQNGLARALNLTRVTAPLIVLNGTGVNDHLSGVEQPVRFAVKDIGANAEIVQSLAKWKRLALGDYGFQHGEGLYTDMNALRPDEVLDNLHSIYVDQWDWERVIHREERCIPFLQSIVRLIYQVIVTTERAVCQRFDHVPGPYLPEEITFVHSEDLEGMYPGLSPRERENAICRDKGAVFVIGIGAPLANGQPHDQRAADYDDWITETGGGKRGLNGDILVWYPVLNCAFELSSMGIRVDAQSLAQQLEIRNEQSKREFYFHQRLLQGQLPLTIGGGIGQSRLCMFYLRKAHVGEVQASVWPAGTVGACREKGIFLL